MKFRNYPNPDKQSKTLMVNKLSFWNILFILGMGIILVTSAASPATEKSLISSEYKEFEYFPTQLVSTESTLDSVNPDIVVDHNNNVHVVWEDRTDYNDSGMMYDIFYKFWNQTTDSWSITQEISTESTSTSNPAIAVDSNNNFHVAWTDGTNYNNAGTFDPDIFYKYWNSTSKIWSKTEVVSQESSDNSWNVAITTDGQDNVHVVWGESANDNSYANILYKFKNITTAVWSIAELISTESTASSYSPKLMIDSKNNFHMVWSDWTNYNNSGTDMDIFYKFRNTTTASWTLTEVISTESIQHSRFPDLTIDSQDNVHITWDDLSNYDGAGNDRDIFYKSKYATTGSWSVTEVISMQSTSLSEFPVIGLDKYDNLHVTWHDDTNYNDAGTDTDIFYKFRNTELPTWSPTEVVSSESVENSRNPAVVVDSYGDIHIVWYDYPLDSDQDIFYKSNSNKIIVTSIETVTSFHTTTTTEYNTLSTTVVSTTTETNTSVSDASLVGDPQGWLLLSATFMIFVFSRKVRRLSG